jgi:hypothetical protein
MRPGGNLGVILISSVALACPVWCPAAVAAGPQASPQCGPGARTLAAPGSALYPEAGNGGYASRHTDVNLVYDANGNRFLPGTNVELEVVATQCLTELSLDFELRDVVRRAAGPNLSVDGVTIDGAPVMFRFARPAYPGDPNGPDDPDPRAHQASQTDPVGGPDHNPLPPACSPSLGRKQKADARNGTLCPATKLVVTPDAPIPSGQAFTVRVGYHGRPGVHQAANGWPEGWFRTRGGYSMLTEPVGTQAWMPLNNHPSAKVSYTFSVRTNPGRTVIANGIRIGIVDHPGDPLFPDGSATTTWQAPDPMASYLALVLVGDYSLDRVVEDGITYHFAQDRHIPAGQRRSNLAVMRKLPASTRFLAQFTGPFPFRSDGVVAAVAGVDVMEMQTMIVFSGSKVDLDTLWHENMHQWWGDHVSQASFDLVFFKEGLATFAESLLAAKRYAARHPGKFEKGLVREFNQTYAERGRFWTSAPSRPTGWSYFSDSASYERPGAAYIALYRILGRDRFRAALVSIQERYGDATITRSELEAAFAAQLPNPTPACQARLAEFFRQWFDTAYRSGGGSQRPGITGPGLAGPGFDGAGCVRA